MRAGIMSKLVEQLWPHESQAEARRRQLMDLERARLRGANKRAMTVADRIAVELHKLECSVKPERRRDPT